MRSILEKALIALLNKEKDQADVLFHNFILERSRQIHESLRQGEDFILDESMENELAIDEMFSEDDLDGTDDYEQDHEATELGEAGDELTDDDAVIDGDDVEVTDDSDDDFEDGDDEDTPESLEDRVTGLEDDLQRLAAEFDAIMDGDELPSEDDELDGDLDSEPVEEGVVEITAHSNGEIDITATTDDDDDDFGVGIDDASAYSDLGDDELDASDFDDLSESAVDALEKVSIVTGDGREQGNGKFTQNNKSVLPTNGVNDRAFKGKPVTIKSDEVSGYPEPTKIASKAIDKRQNIKAKATDGQSPVKKEGDSSALLNKIGADAGGQKSIIGSKK